MYFRELTNPDRPTGRGAVKRYQWKVDEGLWAISRKSCELNGTNQEAMEINQSGL
jgi:hypothetical protein